MFVMICTRQDFVQAMEVVSWFMQNLGKKHWNIVKRILRYIKGTSIVALCFEISELLVVKGYVDSDFTSDLCETKVWLILILMITKQGLELMIIFQV